MSRPVVLVTQLAAVVATVLPGVAGASPIVSREFVFDSAPFAECHASTLVELDDGVVVVAWFGGTEEGADDVSIWTSHRRDGEWTPPRKVADGAQTDGARLPTWNPVLHRETDGTLLLFYKVGPSPREWWGMLRRSSDGGESWSEAERLPEGILGPIKNKPLALDDGRLLCGSSTEHDGWQVHFEWRTAEGEWQRTENVAAQGEEVGAIQPTIVRHRDGRLQALCRSQVGQVVESWSRDGGRSWTPLEKTLLPNPNAGFDATVLADGRILLVYNHQQRDQGRWLGSRRRLDVAVSEDGREWRALARLEDDPPPVEGAEPPGEYSYPAVITARDGRVLVTYTWRRQRIRYVVLDVEGETGTPMVDGRWPEGVPGDDAR